ncbi:MAG: hypothetical protein K6C12_14140 [Oscillospiraceae bacterium]|nr:hypothetical protein [Oscillospiraceae bacterium]
MTEKLFYQDSHLFEFRAEVLRCEQDGAHWRVVLDRTAFFPEGGGQSADTGTLTVCGGTKATVRVTDARERDGEIFHICDAPLRPGDCAEGRLDRQQRLCRMQNHSGEHILSGCAHRLYGCENVGFHLGEGDVTIDFDRELDAEELQQIETRANEAVRADLPVKVWFPEPEELAELEYRSKKELSGAVRIVEIPDVDRCACCAPHVSRTGEIGVIKILNAEKHRGGVRLSVACGMWALEDYRRKQQSAAEVSVLLSAKRDEIGTAVQRLMQERDRLKEKNAALAAELVGYRAEREPETEGNLCLFEEIPDEIAVRELVNRLMEKCGGLAAVFFPGAEGSLRYIIGSRSMDLRKASKAINAGIGGRGGGRPEMIQGSATADREEILRFLREFRATEG